jgi:hypothetical protein
MLVTAVQGGCSPGGTDVAVLELDLEVLTMRRLLIALTFLMVPVSTAAQTVDDTLTVEQVIQISKAGLGEEALLALIEVNRPVFPVDVDTLKRLKEAGVAPKVIVAMIRSGRTEPPAPPAMPGPADSVEPALPVPPVVVVEPREEPVVREVPVAYPVYIPVPVRRGHDRDDHHARPPVKQTEPVYWGWGGKLRPDAWKPATIAPQKDAKVPRTPQQK